MSIMMCEECDKLVDTDYEEMFEVKGFKIICDDCKEKEDRGKHIVYPDNKELQKDYEDMFYTKEEIKKLEEEK